ncbi:MAG: hypothetical protein ACPG52_01645 [Cognaticolwellia sp.]
MNILTKRFISATFILLSISASSVMAQTLAEQLMTLQEKMAEMEGHKTALSTGTSSDSAQDNADDVKIKQANAKKASPLARALAQSSGQLSAPAADGDKILSLDISELKDSSGLVYLGAKVSLADLSEYLTQFRHEVGDEQYAIYRQYQSARDQQSFHVTLINPFEYQTINKEKLKLSQPFRVTLHGLGRAENTEKASYFVVASSRDGQFIRQELLLKNKDFHITLGFFPGDVYGVSKGRDTLINK